MVTRFPSRHKMRPSSLACNECRRRHLKCNGGSPACPRCVTEDFPCTYTPSRRGLGRQARRDTASVRGSSAYTPPASAPASESFNLNAPTQSVSSTEELPEYVRSRTPTTSSIEASATVSCWALVSVDKERLVSAFYAHFYAAHPFIVPRSFYAAQKYPDYLELVVCL